MLKAPKGVNSPAGRSPIVGPNGLPNADGTPDVWNALPVQPEPEQPEAASMDDAPVQRPEIQDVHDQTAGIEPDHAAKVIQLSKALNQPPAVVANSVPEAQKAAATPPTSFFQQLEDRYPGTTKFLSKPENMAVAKDDLQNASQHESLFQRIQDTWKEQRAAWSSGALQEELGFTRYNQLQGNPVEQPGFFNMRLGPGVAARAGITTTDHELRAQQLSDKIAESEKFAPTGFGWRRGLFKAGEFGPQIVGNLGYGAKYGVPAAGATALATIETGPGEVITVPTAYGVGQTAGTLDYNFKLMTGLGYDQLRKVKDANGEPLPENVSKVASYAIGAAASGLGLVKLGAVLENIPGGKEFLAKFASEAGEKVLSNPVTYKAALGQFAKNYVTSVAHGTGAMLGITAANLAGVEAAKYASGQPFEHLTMPEMGQEFSQTAKDAVLTFGILGAPGAGMGLHHDMLLAEHAKAAKDFHTALGDTATESKILQRLPEAYRQMVESQTADGPIKDVYIPQEVFTTYFQEKGLDPALVAEQMGVDQAYEEAIASGGDLKIPLGTFTEKLAPTEHWAGLANDVKYRPDDFTVNEAQQREAELKAEYEKIAAEQDQQVKATETDNSAARVRMSVEKQIKDAGLTAAEVKANPQLIEAFYRTLSEKMGMSPEDLYQKYPLNIQKLNEIEAAQPGLLDKVKAFFQGGLPAVQKKPEQNSLGFYSPVEHEVQKMDFKAMPAKDLLGRIKNIAGLKPEELDYMGLPEWLAAKEADKGEQRYTFEGSSTLFRTESEARQAAELLGKDGAEIKSTMEDGRISKDELLDFIRNRGLQVEQKVLSPDYQSEAAKKKPSSLGGLSSDGVPHVDDLSWDDGELDEPDHNYLSESAGERVSEDLKVYIPGAERTWSNRKYIYDLIGKPGYDEAVQEIKDNGGYGHMYAEKDAELREELTDEDGNIDYPAYKRQMERYVDNEIQQSAYEDEERSYYDGDSGMSSYTHTESETGWRLQGSDDSGWYSPDTGKNYSGNLEEAKIKLMEAMLEDGVARIDQTEIPVGEIRFSASVPDRNGSFIRIEHDYLTHGSQISQNEDGDFHLSVTTEDGNREIDEPLANATNWDEAKNEALQRMQQDGIVTGHQDQTQLESAGQLRLGFDGQPEAPKPPDPNEPKGKSRWGSYAVPGAKNYREFLLKLPKNEGDPFTYSTHWGDEKNVLAHVRVSDRVDAKGRKTLFVEELQSDWHQQGRERGYKQEIPNRNFSEYMSEKHPEVSDEEIARQFSEKTSDPFKTWAAEQESALQNSRAVADAPFKNTEAWAALAMKRMLRVAAEQGYDALAWSPAEVHVERWGTDSLSWVRVPEKEQKFIVSQDRSLARFTVIPEGQAHGRPVEGGQFRYGENARDADVEHAREQAEAFAKENSKTLPAGWAVSSGDTADESGSRINTKEELRAAVSQMLHRDGSERSLESLTENIWKQMQEKDSGVKSPRKEGMEFFYDNLLPKKVLPAILKKLDKNAKVEVGAMETGKTADASFKMWEVPITPELKEKALQGMALFQGGGDSPKGRIRFGTDGSEKIFNIDLLKGADKSTFLHETGHYFLEVMGDVAKGESAPPEIKADYDALLKWLGVEKPEDIKVEHHEKFARGFEAYLREGNAPSPGLRGAFARFRDWLVKLYRDAKSLRVELSDEVRGVMDRMLAAQDEIELAHRGIGYKPEEIQNLTPEVAGRIRALQDQARDIAEKKLIKEQMKELEAGAKARRAATQERVSEAAREEVSKEPLFRAMAELDEGQGRSAAIRASRFLKQAEKGVGLDAEFEVQAEVHGFSNGEDLARQIVQAGKEGAFDKAVAAKVAEGMAAHADMRTTDQIKIEALKAVHQNKMTELLALEREALLSLVDNAEVASKRRQSAAIEASVVKQQARNMLENKPLKEASDSRRYITSERNAAARVAKALAEKDFEAAALAKRHQMLSHALASEAIKNGDEADTLMRRLSVFQKRKADLKNMPYGFIRQIDQLLSRFGLNEAKPEDSKTMLAIAQNMASKGESPGDIANATGLVRDSAGSWNSESLGDLVTRVNDSYYDLEVPPGITAASGRTKDSLTISDLRDLWTTVKAIAQVGTRHDRFLTAFEGVGMKEAATEFRGSVEKNFGAPRAGDLLPGHKAQSKFLDMWDKVTSIPAQFNNWLDTMLTTMDKLDGLKEGPAKKYIYRPLEQAESSRLTRMAEKMKEVDKLFSRFYEPEEFAKYKEKGSGIEIGGREFTKEEILSMALNWGNETNRQRIMDGFKFTDETMQRIFSKLDKHDWDFVQATWDNINKYWPEIVKLEMDVNGTQPLKVDPSPFENEHGKYEGGYYPLSYDGTKSVEGFQHNVEKMDALYKQYSTAKAATSQGHAKARVSNLERPVRLSLDVVRQHHEDVIHDLEYRRAVIDVRRFLENKDVKTAIAGAVGPEGYALVGEWLKNAAGGGSEPMTWIDRQAQKFRFRTTFFILAYRIVSAPKIGLENLVNLSSELGASGAARAIKNYWMGEGGIHEKVVERSAFMRERANHLDRDMGDLFDKWKDDRDETFFSKGLNMAIPNMGLGTSFQRFAFFVHATLDGAVSFPLWSDVYTRRLAEHGNDKLAISQADEAVKRTFMTGSRVDQPKAMRGSEGRKALTVAYGYMSMMWNRFSRQKFEASQEWARGNRAAATMIAARSYVYTFALPALVAALTGNIMRNSSNEDEEADHKRFLAKLIEEGTPLKLIPVLRDVSPYFVRTAMGEHGGSIRYTPMEEAAETLLKPWGELGAAAFGGKDLPEAFPEHIANSLSFMTGVPKQLNDMTFNFMDWQNGNGELTPKDLFSRKTKK